MRLEDCNVVWDSPSPDHRGSMPLGNGDLGLNVWMEPSGDLCFYLGKPDCWDENARLLKVGKVRVRLSPPPLAACGGFKQTLDLSRGEIRFDLPGTTIRVWVDANRPAAHVQVESQTPVKATASLEPWRTERFQLPSLVCSDIYSTCPDKTKVQFVEPDTLLDLPDAVGCLHHNRRSLGPALTMDYQGLADAPTYSDPLLGRTFGMLVKATDGRRLDATTLEAPAATSQRISVHALTLHPSTPEAWLEKIQTLAAADPSDIAAHRAWWAAFWDRSHIYLSEPTVSRAYNLQRFVTACGGRGRYPIKFNGSIFTVPHPDGPGDADYRRWGGGFWWQNTRLPYLSLCASGDYDLMPSLFRMYVDDILPVCLHRTQKYFGHGGAYFPECMYHWGAVFTESYGWDAPAAEREDPLQRSGWHKWEWVAGLELAFMLFDYFDHTQDEVFLAGKLLPLAEAVTSFFAEHYAADAQGKLFMHPAMACETWWDCDNPMPELAGLHSVLRRLLGLPRAGAASRARWQALLDKLPELPLRDTASGKALAPAAQFDKKNNCENPELYAVFPFRLAALGRPLLEEARNALRNRWDRGAFGWRQDDLFMAYLGLADELEANLVERAGNHDPDMRFPAFWGPNYDWTPDQDHGGVLMRACQAALLQECPYSGKLHLLPAWPKHWDASFKLHASKGTVVEGEVKGGELVALKVTPESRRADIVMP